jgi:3'-phosphoadenosine 5'-phosphosulfate sulfotransferase (PAPS reductase)/FAD synthetase
MTNERRGDTSFDVLDEAYERFSPVAVRALFSGGHDSLTATAIAFAWGKARGVEVRAAHINTGTGIPETSEFVRSVCRDQGWSLRELHPKPERDYEWMVKRFGFPGPGQHGLAYRYLKERQLDTLVREAKRNAKRSDRVLLVSGVREQESVRRMSHVERIQRQGAKVFAAPIYNWSKVDCNRFIEKYGLPRNPVVDILHMSGECLCGAFARPGEMAELEAWFPHVADRIHSLEADVEAVGQHGCRWGARPPRVHRDQMKLEVGPLCQSCELREAAA